MLFLVDLEVLGLQSDIVRVPPDGVADGADAVDRARAVAEFVGPRLREQLAPRAGARHRVVARAGLAQRREDLLERGAPDPPLTGRREGELAASILDHLALLQDLAKLVEVDSRVDHAALLEVLHPAERLLHVACRLENELQEELHQLLHRQELAEQIDGVVLVAVSHGQSRASAARHACADSKKRLRSLIVKTL